MDFPVSVYLFGGEGTGWALDTDVETTRQSLQALPDLIRLTSLADAQVVHSVWEYPLLHMDLSLLDGKRIICHLCNDLMRTYEDPGMTAAAETLGLWIANSLNAKDQIEQLGHKASYIPYAIDTTLFTKTLQSGFSDGLRQKYRIPEGTFIISNFMRDSNGTDLQKPKEQKGVELFIAIAAELQRKNLPIHILLAGPRRHWLRNQLDSRGIPYTFVGNEIDVDDNQENILASEKINELYHVSDLHLVTSRWEGGPRAVLEAAATMTPIFCTPVGIAPDILEPECLIRSVDEGVVKIETLIADGKGTYPLQIHFNRIMSSHTPAANEERFRQLYKKIELVPLFDKSKVRWERNRLACVQIKQTIGRRLLNGFYSMRKKKRQSNLTIGLWHEYHKPPYGGGNQFMLALKTMFEQRGVHVVVNKVNPTVDVHICNSTWFDTAKLEEGSGKYPIRMIHRIDGPVSLYRGQGKDEDNQIFSLNERFATATVFQSAYSFIESCGLGYSPISPVIIHNGVNGDIFHDQGRKKYDRKKKISLISAAWSDNPRKGGPFYKWLDENIDFSRFEYTFVGRVQQEFQNIKHIPPQDSEQLAELLRHHDIYITASLNEPCSNSLLEALACGLPALYRNGGGNPELVGFGGLPFEDEYDFLKQLDKIVAYYESIQKSIFVKSMDDIAGKYLKLAQNIVSYHSDNDSY